MAPTSPIDLVLSSEQPFEAREYVVRERVNEPFVIEVLATTEVAEVDFTAIIGQRAELRVRPTRYERRWVGLCSDVALVGHPTTEGIATFAVTIVHPLWLLGQRRNHRIHQQVTEPDIVVGLLDSWNVTHRRQLEHSYATRKYRVQYAESDLAFMRRMLEDSGVAFWTTTDNGTPTVVLDDALHEGSSRARALQCRDSETDEPIDVATKVRLVQRIRPGVHTVRDHDYRLPAQQPLLVSKTEASVALERSLEQFHYLPGGFLFGSTEGTSTPHADDKGRSRTHPEEAEALVQRRLHADRGDHEMLTFETSAFDIVPSTVVTLRDHPYRKLCESGGWLVVATEMSGRWDGEVVLRVESRHTDTPYRPPLVTPRPRVVGVESATVVGPQGEEIHTDEFGRVRVQFHWDRHGQRDEGSSCWMHVAQSWSGAGFGGIQLPRIGQEVLVDFLGGDPDRPVITGRVYTNLQPVPYALPKHKTRSTWKSRSSPKDDGFNEIMFEDLAGEELVWQQAQRNHRRLVKRDEVITVGRNREKLVKQDEQDTTYGRRVENTHGDRIEIDGSSRTTEVDSNHDRLVHGDETLHTEGERRVRVSLDDDEVYERHRRSRVMADQHAIVDGEHRQLIKQTRSLTVVNDDQVRVGRDHALEAGRQIHIRAGDQVVLEAGARLTIKGPGGFIDFHAGGIDVVGQLVRINSGGSAGDGAGASPREPEEADVARPDIPKRPPVDDVSETGIGQ